MKHSIKLTLIVLCMGILPNIGSAQLSEEFTLAKAKQHAIDNHISIINANQDVAIARKQIIEYRGIGLPQVTVSGQFQQFINLPVSVVDATIFNPMAQPGEVMEFRMGQEFSSSGTLQVNQLLFSGSYIVGLQAADYFARFQESVSQATQEEVLFNLSQAYYLAAVAKENKLFVDSMVVITNSLVDKQQHYLELGLMLQEDMDQLSYSLLTAKNAAVEANAQYENTLNMVKLAMGYPIEQDITIQETPEDLMNGLSSTIGDIHENMQYQLAEKQIQLSLYNVKNNKLGQLPTLSAYFTQAYNAYRNEFNFFADEKWYPQTIWGLQLNMPVFTGLQRHSKTQQAKIAVMQNENKLAQLEESLKFQEIQGRNNVNAARDKYNLQKQNIELAQTIYTNATKKEKIGSENSIAVTQKYNQLMVAQSQYLGSMIELFNAELTLDKIYNKILSNQ